MINFGEDSEKKFKEKIKTLVTTENEEKINMLTNEDWPHQFLFLVLKSLSETREEAIERVNSCINGGMKFEVANMTTHIKIIVKQKANQIEMYLPLENLTKEYVNPSRKLPPCGHVSSKFSFGKECNYNYTQIEEEENIKKKWDQTLSNVIDISIYLGMISGACLFIGGVGVYLFSRHKKIKRRQYL